MRNLHDLLTLVIYRGRPQQIGLPTILAALNEVIAESFCNARDRVLNPVHRMFGCMDGGVKQEAMGSGGSGLVAAYVMGETRGLSGLDAIQGGLGDVAKMVSGRAMEITSHDDCGAAVLIYKQLSTEEKRRFNDADSLAKWFAQSLASELQKLGQEVGYRHISIESMLRPHSRHSAQLVFYSGTAMFDVDPVIPDARAFKISRGLLNLLGEARYGARVGSMLLATAARIALGPYGLGEQFGPLRPFLVVPVGGDMMGLKELREEAELIVAPFQGCVRVLDGFTLE